MDDGPGYGILRKGFDGGEVMASISERLDAMEAEIRKPRFRESTGMANEVHEKEESEGGRRLRACCL